MPDRNHPGGATSRAHPATMVSDISSMSRFGINPGTYSASKWLSSQSEVVRGRIQIPMTNRAATAAPCLPPVASQAKATNGSNNSDHVCHVGAKPTIQSAISVAPDTRVASRVRDHSNEARGAWNTATNPAPKPTIHHQLRIDKPRIQRVEKMTAVTKSPSEAKSPADEGTASTAAVPRRTNERPSRNGAIHTDTVMTAAGITASRPTAGPIGFRIHVTAARATTKA